MKAAASITCARATLGEALAALQGDQAMPKLLAGGQSLGRCSTCAWRGRSCWSTSSRIDALRAIDDEGTPGASAPPSPMPSSRTASSPAATMLCARGARHRLSRGAQPRHHRRQPGACRSRGRLAARAGGARRDGRRRGQGRPTRSAGRRFHGRAPSRPLADDEIIVAVDVPKLSAARALRLLQVLPQDRRIRRSQRGAVFDPEPAPRAFRRRAVRAAAAARCGWPRSSRGRARPRRPRPRSPSGRPRRRGGACRAADARRGGRARPQAGLRAMTADRDDAQRRRRCSRRVEPRTHLGDFLRDSRA